MLAEKLWDILVQLNDNKRKEKILLDRVYSALEEVYPQISAYESRSALFRKGVEDGYISQAVCDYAKTLLR